jgi:hypothetical protein
MNSKVLNEQAEVDKKVVFVSKPKKKYSQAMILSNKPSTVRDRKNS